MFVRFSTLKRGLSAALSCVVISASVMAPLLAIADVTPAAPPAGTGVATAQTVQTKPNAKVSRETVASTSQGSTDQSKGVTGKAIDAAKNVAKDAVKDAVDILARIPCLPVKGTAKLNASLPRVASHIAAGEPVTIVALGSSSTQGFGSTSSDYTYPNRLAAQLRHKYPYAEINVVNRGIGGQDTKEMLARLDLEVISLNPDLVMWQLGTNTVVRGGDIQGTEALVEEGVSRLQLQGADIVLIDPQYAPAVNAKMEGASKMVKIIKDVANLKHVTVFPRFEVMREWHEEGKMPFDSFVISDGLHMNDWGYACFAQLLGDTIIKSVGQVSSGYKVPPNVMTYRPK